VTGQPGPGAAGPPARPGHRGQAAQPAQPDRPASDRALSPGGRPAAPSFDAEIRAAVRYERGLAVKALLAIALVVAVLTLRACFAA
jgi:hypothetical protein